MAVLLFAAQTVIAAATAQTSPDLAGCDMSPVLNPLLLGDTDNTRRGLAPFLTDAHFELRKRSGSCAWCEDDAWRSSAMPASTGGPGRVRSVEK